MRIAAIDTLVDLAGEDPRVMLLTGDLGFTVVERFATLYPDRFVNVGVAEQNMVGLSTGLAEAGYRPFLYSIAPFAVLRPFEFLRNGPAHHRLPVTILGVGGGYEYGLAGSTHFALEDLGAMRLLPGVTVLAPADADQARTAVRLAHAGRSPAYLRLGRDENERVPGLDGRLRLGRVEVVREGGDALILVTGTLAMEAIAAADALVQHRIRATVAVVACISPAPAEDLAGLLASHPLVVTLEAHVRPGGLGELVAGIAAEQALRVRWVPLHARPERLDALGSAAWLHARQNLCAPDVVAALLAART